MSVPRLAVVCDMLEENWPSMNLVGEMLLAQLRHDHAETFAVEQIRPPMRRRLTRAATTTGQLFNLDRLLNRFRDYPRVVAARRAEFDLFHIVDHSYGQLVHQLPPERTIITCHDLDTFQCLLNGTQPRRSFFFRAMTKQILAGLKRAARVTCDSQATRAELLAHGLIEPERAVVIHNGVHPACAPEADTEADAEAARLLGPVQADAIEILHVGSVIPRKRIDVLLRVVAALRREFPRVRLVRVGGAFNAEQARLVAQLKLTDSVVVLPHLDRKVLAAVYRRAAIVLQPSEREGFGLPVVEAMACGTPVVASDLAVLREVGGTAAAYCPVGALSAWTETVTQLLSERSEQPQRWHERRVAGIAQAANFSWAEYARKMVAIYRQLL